MTPSTPAELRRRAKAFRDKVNKNSKYRKMAQIEDVPNPYFLRRPSGIMQLDIHCGGGIPAGGVSYISGPEGAGKTWLLFNYFAMHQKIYGEMSSILYVPTEFLPDIKFMRQLGVRVSMPDEMLAEINYDRQQRRLPVLTKEEVAELKSQIGVFDILRGLTSEEILDKLLEAYHSGIYNIIALDSVSIIQAAAEAETGTLDKLPQQAANAMLLTRFMQHFHPLTMGLEEELATTTMFFTSQVRANRHKSEVSSYYAKNMKDWATGGANAMKHGKFIDVQIWTEAKIREGGKDDKKVVGKTFKWVLPKAKIGACDNASGEYNFRYSSPGDHIPHLLITAIQHGAARETEKGITFFDGQTREPLALPDGTAAEGIPGINGLRNLFAVSPAAEFTIRREILTAAGVGTCLYRELQSPRK